MCVSPRAGHGLYVRQPTCVTVATVPTGCACVCEGRGARNRHGDKDGELQQRAALVLRVVVADGGVRGDRCPDTL